MSEPTNDDRAARAAAALEFYSNLPGMDEAEFCLVDLLADLQHWARANGQDFAATLATATDHFETEQDEEPDPDGPEAPGAPDPHCPECQRSNGPHYRGPCHH